MEAGNFPDLTDFTLDAREAARIELEVVEEEPNNFFDFGKDQKSEIAVNKSFGGFEELF
jgi:hypothetical protein